MSYSDVSGINAGISAVLASSPSGTAKEYRLPDKEIYVDSHLDVPAGSSDLHLILDSRKTRVLPTAAISGIIRLGYTSNNVNDVFTGSGLVTSTIVAAAKGATTITLNVAQLPLTVGNYYAITDSGVDNTGNRVNAELIKVTAYDAGTRVATLDRPLSRPYASSPVVRHVNARVSRNLRLSGGYLLGSVGAVLNSGGIWATMVDQLVISGVKGELFDTDIIRAELCRDVIIEDVELKDYPGGSDAGKGRGSAAFWCVDHLVRRGKFSGLRHGTMVASCGRYVVEDCTGNSTLSHDFDEHGQLSFDGRYSRCRGGTTLQIGNGSFWTGNRNTIIEDCDVKTIYVVGDCRDVTIRRCKSSILNFQSWGTSVEDYRPKNVRVSDTEVTLDDGVNHPISLSGGSWKSLHSLTLERATVNQRTTAGGKRCMLFEGASGDMAIDILDSRFNNASPSRAIEISGGVGGAVLAMNVYGSHFAGTGSPAILLGTATSGNVSLAQNEFPAGVTHITNQGTGTVAEA